MERAQLIATSILEPVLEKISKLLTKVSPMVEDQQIQLYSHMTKDFY